MQRPRQHERRLAVDQRQRRVGGQPDHGRIVGIADMIAAERAVRQRLAVIAGRPHADGDARQAGDRLDDAVELRRPEHAAELAKARREVGDLDLAAAPVGQHGARRSRVLRTYSRLKIHHVVEHDVGESLFLLARDQPAEDRIAVEARIAPPHDPRTRIDQRRHPAVADDAEIQAVIDHSDAPASPAMRVKPGANRFRLIEMSIDVRHNPADRKSQAAELRNDAEHRLIGRIVADKNRIAAGERRMAHQFADRIGLVDAGRL